MAHLSPIYRVQDRKIADGHPAYRATEGVEFETRAAALGEFDDEVRRFPQFYAPGTNHRLVVKAVQP